MLLAQIMNVQNINSGYGLLKGLLNGCFHKNVALHIILLGNWPKQWCTGPIDCNTKPKPWWC